MGGYQENLIGSWALIKCVSIGLSNARYGEQKLVAIAWFCQAGYNPKKMIFKANMLFIARYELFCL